MYVIDQYVTFLSCNCYKGLGCYLAMYVIDQYVTFLSCNCYKGLG